MQQIHSINSLREALDSIRHSGKTIGLVPTMGNLHAGHLSLIELAASHADVVVASIFVNPSQFVEGEDFADYPRTLATDLEKLGDSNTSIVFIPDVESIYPADMDTEVTVPSLDSIYCGEYRPGHFKGVATVVTKLFNIVCPDVAVFGEKDYQQLLVIRRLVADLNIPVQVISAPIVRESDGLAMSSRNQYLSDTERDKATKLYECLSNMAEAIKLGRKDFANMEAKAVKELTAVGFKPDYVSIRDANTLNSAQTGSLVIIAAAWLGKARLIDNVAVQSYD